MPSSKFMVKIVDFRIRLLGSTNDNSPVNIGLTTIDIPPDKDMINNLPLRPKPSMRRPLACSPIGAPTKFLTTNGRNSRTEMIFRSINLGARYSRNTCRSGASGMKPLSPI